MFLTFMLGKFRTLASDLSVGFELPRKLRQEPRRAALVVIVLSAQWFNYDDPALAGAARRPGVQNPPRFTSPPLESIDT